MANIRIVELLVPSGKRKSPNKNPFEMFFSNEESDEDESEPEEELSQKELKRKMAHKLALGELEDRMVTIEVSEQNQQMSGYVSRSWHGTNGYEYARDVWKSYAKEEKETKTTCIRCSKSINEDEAQKLIDMDDVNQEAIQTSRTARYYFYR